MVGRCIPYWNSPFLGDMLVFGGVYVYCIPYKSNHQLGIFHIYSRYMHNVVLANPWRPKHRDFWSPQIRWFVWQRNPESHWDVLLVLRINKLFHPYISRLDTSPLVGETSPNLRTSDRKPISSSRTSSHPRKKIALKKNQVKLWNAGKLCWVGRDFPSRKEHEQICGFSFFSINFSQRGKPFRRNIRNMPELSKHQLLEWFDGFIAEYASHSGWAHVEKMKLF